MESFLSTEVIAGIILGFYFIFKGIAAVKTQPHISTNGTAAKAVAENEYRRSCMEDHRILRSKVERIHARIEEWDDMIKAGDFYPIWSQKEVIQIMEKVDRILADGPWTANLQLNREKIAEVKDLLEDIQRLISSSQNK